jgi:hypothetical protein
VRLLRSYADRGAAELDLALLRANRIDAVLDETGGAAPELRLSVPADQHLPALALLTDEAESHAQVPAVARSGARRTIVMLIRAAALYFVVNALLYLAALGEHGWRGGAAPPAPTAPQRGGAQEDFAHLALHALLGGLLLAYAEPLARVLCRDRSPRRSDQG